MVLPFLIVLGAIASLNTVISVVDTMYALMAIPTMTASLALAPKVNQAARRYFRKDAGGSG